MAVADGYAMCRYPGCIPFIVFIKRAHEEWEVVERCC